ncbi:MAG TPA: ABC transporter permease [Chloroflexota bacterium]|nr:ABC transporter permease [Chloroflexota bacterium]
MATAEVVDVALPPASGAAAAEPTSGAEHVSQWTLMRWRFFQNRLSVAALYILIGMYLIAALAPFFAPYDANALDSAHSFAEPTRIAWIDGRLAVCPLEQTLDTYNFKWDYTADCSQARPIEFFVRGFQYRLFGVLATDRHLFGVSAGPPLPGAPPKSAPAPAADDPLAAFRTSPAPGTAGQPGATQSAAPPGQTDGRAPKIFLLGADQQGRDLLSRILEGSRVSLTIGLVGVAMSLVIGSVMGATSGYLGGAADNVMQRLLEIIRSVPTIPLWAAIAAALPRNTTVVQRYFLITLVISLINWTGLARELRGKVMAYRNLDYVAAARLAGNSHLRIILTHMLPNAASHIIVVATLAVPISILAETTLSFLGLGMLPPAVSWGVLLKDAQQVDAVILHPWLLLPAVPVIVTVACYFLLGDGLRDAVDPYG